MQTPGSMRLAIAEYTRECVDIVRSTGTSFEFNVVSVSYMPATINERNRLYGYLVNQATISNLYDWHGESAYLFSLGSPIDLKHPRSKANDRIHRVELLPPSLNGEEAGRFVRTTITPRHISALDFVMYLKNVKIEVEEHTTSYDPAWFIKKNLYELWIVRSIEAAAYTRTIDVPFDMQPRSAAT